MIPAGRPSIGLALEGGGALGLAHIGVLEWMEDNHVPVDRIAGTSMGSLVGGLYASGLAPDQLRALATGNAFQSVFAIQQPYTDLSFRRREDRYELPGAISGGLRHGFHLPNALVDERGVNGFLLTNMSSYNSQSLDFNQMPIPFRCVATDLNTLGPVIFRSGPLPAAVRASISIPGVFPPVLDARGHSLVDGGIVNNLPTEVVRGELEAGVVIAIHLDDGGAVDGVDTSSLVAVLNRAFSVGIARNVAESLKSADLVIAVPVGKYTTTDYNKGGQLIREGYLAAERNRAALMRYALPPTAWEQYRKARQARMRPAPALLQAVRVVGGTPVAQASARSSLDPLVGRPIAAQTTIEALKSIQSDGSYTASYETFRSASAEPASASGSGTSAELTDGPDNAIQVRIWPNSIAPPYLLIAPVLAAETSNPERTALEMRIIDQNLGGFGSELRGSLRVGTESSLAAEYYRLLSKRGWYVEPYGSASREPVYIWQNQKRIAERSEQNLLAGLEFGRTLSHSTQLSVLWRAEQMHWALVTGSGGGPAIAGSAQTGALRLAIDKNRSGGFSPDGWRLIAEAGSLYHAVQSANAPLAELSFQAMHSIERKNIVGVGAEAHSTFRTNVAAPFRFTLGGPLRLSASSFDEYRGTDLWLARTGYLRRLTELPTGFGQGLYAIFGYEAGEVWSPELPVFLRQDGLVGAVADTPLGLITMGVSVGDAGHRKMFLTIGRWF